MAIATAFVLWELMAIAIPSIIERGWIKWRLPSMPIAFLMRILFIDDRIKFNGLMAIATALVLWWMAMPFVWIKNGWLRMPIHLKIHGQCHAGLWHNGWWMWGRYGWVRDLAYFKFKFLFCLLYIFVCFVVCFGFFFLLWFVHKHKHTQDLNRVELNWIGLDWIWWRWRWRWRCRLWWRWRIWLWWRLWWWIRACA